MCKNKTLKTLKKLVFDCLHVSSLSEMFSNQKIKKILKLHVGQIAVCPTSQNTEVAG